MDFLNTDIQYIKGIGPVLAAKLNDLLGGRRILDFLLHRPKDLKFRPTVKSISQGTDGEIITIPLKITAMKPAFRRAPSRFTAEDINGDKLTIQFFGTGFTDYWIKQLPIGETRIISGKLELSSSKAKNPPDKTYTICHPDYITRPEDAHKIPEFQAIYPLTEGLTQKIMQTLRDAILPKIPAIPEWHILTDPLPYTLDIPGRIFASHSVTPKPLGFGKAKNPPTTNNRLGLAPHENYGSPIISFTDSLRRAHFPEALEDTQPDSPHIRRLAFDELFAHQLAIALTRKATSSEPGISMPSLEIIGPDKTNLLLSLLPFELTLAQKRAVDDIFSDMAKPTRTSRLIQGDVGSGKTIVALLAMLRATENNAQAALLSPTDALAQQHFAKIKPYCDQLDVHCEILTGRDTGRNRHEKLVSLKSGRTKILIGTHALFQESVEYKNLGLAIIDEQHRFGVNQRLALADKGAATDILALSATPIPRTLSMTIYGDMDISIIDSKPANRLPIKTSQLSFDKIPALISRLKEKDAKIFWVVPLVEESKTSDLASAETRYSKLVHELSNPAPRDGVTQNPQDFAISRAGLDSLQTQSVGLIHGKMKKEDRDAIMERFADSNDPMKILVATTVIEVGIDVPQATIMVIEDAWRFGLSQLHQIRGRVGRGSDQSYCILLQGRGMTPEGMKRLEILCGTDDGFEIAEHDLAMRGIGEMLGVKQSGFIDYKFVDWRAHKDLFRLAAANARDLVREDPELTSPRGMAARLLLQIFGRTQAMQFVKAG